MRWRGITVTAVVIVASLIALNLTSDFLVDLIWFSTVGYRQVFWTIFGSKVGLFFTVFVVSTIFLWVNGTLALRSIRRQGRLVPVPFDQGSPTGWTPAGTLPEWIRRVSVLLSWHWLIAGVAVLLGVLIAVIELPNWDVVLRFIYQVPYGESDPGVRQGHWLLSVFASGVCRAQELDAAGSDGQRSRRRRGVFGAWRHHARPGTATVSPAAAAHGSALLGLYLRCEGLVLRFGPLPAALRRQRSRGGSGLHRYPCQAAASLGAGRTSVRRCRRLMGQHARADVTSFLSPRWCWCLEARSCWRWRFRQCSNAST